MIIQIPPAYEGRLLRSFLTHTLALSSGTLARLKACAEGIMVNGHHVTVRYVLHAGDCLALADTDTLDTATRTVIPVEGPLDILYEDDHLMVLNKPAGMPTHPSHGHLTDTLANALAYRYQVSGVPFVFRPLGRLDRNTSGVVVMGKTQATAGFLGRAMCQHQIVKRYLAVLEGVMPAMEGLQDICAPILRPLAGVAMRAVGAPDAPGAEYALTRYRVLARSTRRTLVLCLPQTGRTHQLRVHFAHLGYPLVGDDIYGTPSDDLPRHALHAFSLSLPLPFAPLLASPDLQDPFKTPLTLDSLPPDTPLNSPSEDAYLHTWACLPEDMERLIQAEFSPSGGSVCPSALFAHGGSPLIQDLRKLTDAST